MKDRRDEADLTEAYELPNLDDARLIEVSRQYLAELESGSSPDKQIYIARYPDISEEVEECLDGIDLAFTLQKNSKFDNPLALNSDTQPLGDFRIVKEIGRGGMGIVYEATQLSLGRRVALKVLPFAAGLDERHLQRFRLEAQSAAQLHHNNIVPVYAVGCDRGTHYYAMQLINGQPISVDAFDSVNSAKKVETHQASTIVDTRRGGDPSLTVHSLVKYRDRYRAIAALIADVADALEYAHSCGIVHRDIKPANLLLDAYGKIWITDFGLAHVAANNQVTQTGDLVGTLRYMSPEQASGQRGVVDHRADIYSLGATLYELLSRKPIYEGQDRQSLLHQILNDDPRPPRQIDAAIPIELETIVMKATQHSPGDRYASAGALAADLKRFLNEMPILAKRPTVVDQVRKWMRRHPSAVASMIFTLVIGVIALGVTTAVVARQATVVAKQKQLTQESFERERERADEANRRLDLAQKAADEMIKLAEDPSLDSIFEESMRQRLLDTALNYYQQFISERSGDQTAQSKLQVTLDRIGKTLEDLDIVQSDRATVFLSDPNIQADLKLTEVQKKELEQFFQDNQNGEPSMERRPGKPPHGGFEKVIERSRESQAELGEILTAAQLQRLKQIALQLQGKFVLMKDLRVIQALKLTNDQRKQMHSIEMNRFDDWRPMGPPDDLGPPGEFGPPLRGELGPPHTFRELHEVGPPSDFGPPRDGGRRRGGPGGFGKRGFGGPFPLDWRDILEQYNNDENRKLMNDMLQVLTPEQRAKWNELVGPPLVIPKQTSEGTKTPQAN